MADQSSGVRRDCSDACARICERVEEHSALIRVDLKSVFSRWNAVAVVGSLPAEILAEIFRLACGQDMLTREQVYKGSYARVLLNITHVCRWWREVATAAASLWAHIVLTSRSSLDDGLIPTFVARSQDAPISLHVSRNAPTAANFMSVFQTYGIFPRLRSIESQGPLLLFAQLVEQSRAHSHTLLTSLELDGGSYYSESIPDIDFEPPSSFPSLKTCLLRGIPAPWVAPLATPQLRVLDLHDLRGRLSPHQLLTVLSRTPLLEILRLNRPLELGRDRDQQVPYPALPHLRVLDIRRLDHWLPMMLEHLIVPAATICRLSGTVYEDSTLRLLRAFDTHLSRRQFSTLSNPMQACTLEVGGRVYVQLSDAQHGSYCASRRRILAQGELATRTSFDVSGLDRKVVTAVLWPLLQTHIPPLQLKYLRLSVVEPAELISAPCIEFLSQLQNLQMLYLDQSSLALLLFDPARATLFKFPHLTSLALGRLDTSDVQELVTILKQRADAGHPLDSFSVRAPLRSDDLDVFRAFVPDVSYFRSSLPGFGVLLPTCLE